MNLVRLITMLGLTLSILLMLPACDSAAPNDSNDQNIESPTGPGNTDPNEPGGGIDPESGLAPTPSGLEPVPENNEMEEGTDTDSGTEGNMPSQDGATP